ncbi:MAG TPA: universal stress protein [Actinomycetota bacterium]|nr:universal stress protein [Actinomycetota bacterium]
MTGREIGNGQDRGGYRRFVGVIERGRVGSSGGQAAGRHAGRGGVGRPPCRWHPRLGRVSGTLLGSGSHAVVHHAPCPVTVVPTKPGHRDHR